MRRADGAELAARLEPPVTNPHRIDQLAPPPPQKPETPSPWKAWAIRAGVSIAGLALGASCPAWPPPVQPICRIVATAVQGLSTTIPEPPPVAPRETTDPATAPFIDMTGAEP